jgi:hypothetical protein
VAGDLAANAVRQHPKLRGSVPSVDVAVTRAEINSGVVAQLAADGSGATFRRLSSAASFNGGICSTNQLCFQISNMGKIAGPVFSW